MQVDPRNSLSEDLIFAPKVTLVAASQVVNWPDFAHGEGQGQGRFPERLVELAGRECYDSWGRGRKSPEYHAHIAEALHGSVLEHANFTFRISGVSRYLTHELIRHRAGCAVSQRSTRYVDEGRACVVVPPALIITETDSAEKAQEKRARQADLLTFTKRGLAIYRQLAVNASTTARKTMRGAARAFLPSQLETSLIWTANARALLNVIEQRFSDAADAEICRLTGLLLTEMAVEMPSYFGGARRQLRSDGLGDCLVQGTLRAF